MVEVDSVAAVEEIEIVTDSVAEVRNRCAAGEYAGMGIAGANSSQPSVSAGKTLRSVQAASLRLRARLRKQSAIPR